MTMDTDKHTDIDLIMPYSQIGVIGVDLDFRIDLWILRPIVRHRDKQSAGIVRLKFIIKGFDGGCFFRGHLVPIPKDQWTRENCRYLGHQKLLRSLIYCNVFMNNIVMDKRLALIRQDNACTGSRMM